MKKIDTIIIGSGMSGLYSAYQIKNSLPKTSYLVLEKYKKNWIGGRTSNDIFAGTEIVTGAGIGRKNKDKLLRGLVQKFKLPSHEYKVEIKYSKYLKPISIMKILRELRRKYKKNHKSKKYEKLTFKKFAIKILGNKIYKNFIKSAGYTDYENEDISETLYKYGIEDNTCCWTAFTVPWKKLIIKLYNYIGKNNVKFSSKVTDIQRIKNNKNLNKNTDKIKYKDEEYKFIIKVENGKEYMCKKVIIATTISGIKSLLPQYNKSIYNNIEGQPFLRLYAKVSAQSILIMKEYIKGFTFVTTPLQRIIPINPDKGIYMIAYNDNKNTIMLKNNLKDTPENREFYEKLIEKTFGMSNNSIHIMKLKDYYWPIGTHYYKPLNKKLFKSRNEFLKKAQNPENGIIVVGEVVSRNQGWTEGALESVEAVKNKILNKL